MKSRTAASKSSMRRAKSYADIMLRIAPLALVLCLLLSGPAAAASLSASDDTITLTLDGKTLTISAEQANEIGDLHLTAGCIAGAQSFGWFLYIQNSHLPFSESKFDFSLVSRRATWKRGEKSLQVTFDRDISDQVDICGIEEAVGGQDLAWVAYTSEGATELNGNHPEQQAADALDSAYRAVQRAYRKSNRYPAGTRLVRLLRRGRLDAGRLLGSLTTSKLKVNKVYVLSDSRSQRLRLACRSSDGSTWVLTNDTLKNKESLQKLS